MPETTPTYATFSGNCLHLDNGVDIGGFPDGTRGKFRVKIVSVEQGMFEHTDEDLNGCTNHEYYPVKITTVGISDGNMRTHLTNDETMFAPGKSGGLPIVEAALRPDGDISVVGEYYTQDNILRSLCHGIKDGNADDIARAARLMAKLVRPGDTLVPIPSRTGVATTAKLLAEAISKVTGAPVVDILKGASRKSMYEMKKGGTIPGEEFLGLRLEGEPPENTVFVDNVVATGTTARAALRLVPGSRLIALANASTHQPNWNIPVDFRGKSEDPELNMTEAADSTDGVFERIAQKAAELEPFGIGLLQKNCVDSLWKVSEPTGGMMRKATRPIRFIHYTESPEALESILNTGIRQNICIETSRNDVWANILSKDLLDRNKLFVVFDIPEGTPFSLENNTQAVFFQTIPPEWFVSVNTDIGPRGNTRLLDYIGRHDERWPEQRVREFFDDPENADIWSYITRPTLVRLLKLYTGFDIRHDGTQEGQMTEGISMIAAAFVESAQTRFVREGDLDKYADEVDLKKLNEKMPEKKTGFVLVPADLVAIVARRIEAVANYDGLNFTADPDGMELHLSNGYMDGTLSYDTYAKALRAKAGNGEYPLDETTDLDGITKAIIGDMDPERFETRIAGKYDLGNDLVTCIADELRKRAERNGKKIRVRNEGRKLSVTNPGVDDNCNSTELEWDPESKKLRCPDSGNEYDLDENTNIRKLGHELYERVGAMDL